MYTVLYRTVSMQLDALTYTVVYRTVSVPLDALTYTVLYRTVSMQLDALTYTVLYRTVSLLVVLFDTETLCLTLWEEMRLEMFGEKAPEENIMF
jgi:hypothetical protein